MAYGAPPLVANASAAIPAAGSTTVAVVAAPGVGFAIRVVGAQICVNRASGAVCDCVLNDAGGGSILRGFGLNVAGSSCVTPPVVEPGLQLTENQALNLVGTSTAGVGTFSCTVHYYIDSV